MRSASFFWVVSWAPARRRRSRGWPGCFKTGARGSESSLIFRKQLEEADYIAVNKVDALAESEVDRLVELARKANPGAPVVPISARTGQGFDRLMELIDGRSQVAGRVLVLDYDRYARGEAELGWLNCRVKVSSVELLFALDDLLMDLVSCQPSIEG